MIYGIGTDLCCISRMREALVRGHFAEKVFSRQEIEYANSKSDPARHFAAAYAAKEALAKATGLGMFKLGIGRAWVRRSETGPVLECSEELSALLRERGIGRRFLSLSHEGDFALAFVVLEVML